MNNPFNVIIEKTYIINVTKIQIKVNFFNLFTYNTRISKNVNKAINLIHLLFL